MDPELYRSAEELLAQAQRLGHDGDPYGVDVFALGVLARYFHVHAIGTERGETSTPRYQASMDRAAMCMQTLYWIDPDLIAEPFHDIFAEAARETALRTGAAEWGATTAQWTTQALNSSSRQLLCVVVTRARLAPLLAPAGALPRSAMLSDLCAALHALFELVGDRTDLDSALQAGRQAVSETPPDSDLHSLCLNNLAMVLRTRYEHTGALADLDEAIELSRLSIESARTPYTRAHRQSNLCVLLRMRFRLHRAPSDIDDSIQLGCSSITGLPPTSTVPEHRSNLAAALIERWRYDRGGDLGHAIELLDSALDTPNGPALTALNLTRLSTALLFRFDAQHSRADLDRAVQTARQALEHPRAGTSILGTAGCCLAAAVLARFHTDHDPADIDTAVDIARAAVGHTPAEHADRKQVLMVLSAALGDRLSLRDDSRDLNELIETNAAVSHGERADRSTQAGSEPHPSPRHSDVLRDQRVRGEALIDLAYAYHRRFTRTGSVRDLHAAVETTGEALESIGSDDNRWLPLAALFASRLRARFEQTGDLRDLNHAVAIARDGIALSLQHPVETSMLIELSTSLRLRYEHVGSGSDLDEALSVARRAADRDLSPSTRAGLLSLLGVAIRLKQEFASTAGGAVDLGVELARFAILTAEQETVPVQTARRSNLGIQLLDRYYANGRLTDLDEAIEQLHLVTEATAPDAVDTARNLTNLALALTLRGSATESLSDIAEAITLHTAAVKGTAGAHPDHGGRLSNLAFSWKEMFMMTNDQAHLRAAISTWQAAAGANTTPTRVRINAASQWGRAATRLNPPDHALSARGFHAAVSLLPHLAWHGLSRVDRQIQLTRWPLLATDAAAAHVAANETTSAVELLESGRAVLWRQMLHTRTDLAAVQAVNDTVAQRLDYIRVHLDHTDNRLRTRW
ncbi:tetratricopeptide repeat protein [Nocardia beijingensis]